MERLSRPLEWPFGGILPKSLFMVSGFGGGRLPHVPHSDINSSFSGADWVPVQPNMVLGSLV